MIYSGKRAVVLGLGHSGEAAAILLREEGADVTICESCDNPGLRDKSSRLKAQGIEVILGPAADSNPAAYDVCILSPGIDSAVPLVQNVLRKRIPVIGELELAFEECICPVVAITGTNGKTTTTELTTAMLQGSGVRTMASGNIGLPFATAVRQSNELDVMILEVSSFQLETINAFRPHVSVWLNLSPNHLDRYRDMEEYRRAKLRIFMNQTSEDFSVVNARENLPPISARMITFSAYDSEADFTLRNGVIHYRNEPVLDQRKTRLAGIHNAENLMAALGVGLALGVEFERMAAAVGEYTAPVHRCEFVRDLEGVRWINDSKATNLDSVEKAILSQTRPIVLIAGGKDKGFEFDSIAPLVRERVRVAVLIGEMKERISRSWSGVDCRISASLEEAVELAREAANDGDTVLFSPGTSSYDMFRNYGERGNRFKNAVNALK
jgi:UDP-N-acetylmuramoylalanine--D-glutamate ligase